MASFCAEEFENAQIGVEYNTSVQNAWRPIGTSLPDSHVISLRSAFKTGKNTLGSVNFLKS